jgi:hypothetical protein
MSKLFVLPSGFAGTEMISRKKRKSEAKVDKPRKAKAKSDPTKPKTCEFNGDACPVCQGFRIKFSEASRVSPAMTLYFECEQCKSKWGAYYSLTSFVTKMMH